MKTIPKKHTAYMLRTCSADMTSHGGFIWPESGPVDCHDWKKNQECGNGLHGLLWGEGNGGLLDWSPDAKWLVVKIDAREIVDLNGKIKVPRGEVVYCGDRLSATDEITRLGAGGAVVGGTATAGDRGTATAGYKGTATAGDWGTATAGDWGTATAGDEGEIRIRWWDGRRYRLAVGYTGEDGIKANTPYRVVDGVLVEANQDNPNE